MYCLIFLLTLFNIKLKNMDIIRFSINGLNVYRYCEAHLKVINHFLPAQLTNKEIEVLAGFMALGGDLIEQDRFGTQARKEIRDRLGISNGGLGNHLKSLQDKAFIYKDEKNKLQINNHLIPSTKKIQGYQFKISGI